MSVGSIQNALIGFALFDMFEDGMKKLTKANQPVASPLVDAAFKAFENYLNTQEVQHAALISSVAMYALSPKGGVSTITKSDIAPMLALNVMA